MREERRSALTFGLGLFFLAACLSLPYGVRGEEQGVGYCSGNACYTVHLGKVKFTTANNSCINKGGNLVTIRSEEEATNVHDLMVKLANSTHLTNPLKLWIGLYLKKNCVINEFLLKGFSWITGSADTSKSTYSNWMRDLRTSCTRELCVSMLSDMNSRDHLKWASSSCSAELNGYICKFDFEGMCPPLLLAGPGFIEYETPFSVKSSSWNLLPHGSSAYVSCGSQGDKEHMLFCKNFKDRYNWGDIRVDRPLGPLCASEELGCKYNNGGCEHECVETPPKGSISCTCREGYVLASDMVSCVFPIEGQLTTPGFDYYEFTSSDGPVGEMLSESHGGYSIMLLIGILSACSVVLLLLVAGGVLCYRRRNAKKKEAENPQRASDNFFRGLESETKAVDNDYQ